MTQPIYIPLLNPNESEAVLVALHISDRQQIAKGDLLCTLETTKSTADIEAEADGYITGLRCRQGQIVKAGDLLCYLVDDPTWQPPAEPISEHLEVEQAVPQDLRITQPALNLARQLGVNLENLPTGSLITESLLRSYLQQQAGAANLNTPQSAFDPSAIIVYGGGGHGRSLVDLLRVLNVYRIVGVLDDGMAAGETIMDLPVLGGSEQLSKLYTQGVRLAVNAVGGISSLETRLKVFQTLSQAGFVCPTVVHPTAFIEPSAILSPGVQVFPHAYVGSQARVGYGCIVNTGAIISHDCVLENYTNISPGAMLAGEVQTGAGVLVGMGATINLRVKLGTGARIGNGATVKEDVPERAVVRAGMIWPA